jgi:hypothetical protein
MENLQASIFCGTETTPPQTEARLRELVMMLAADLQAAQDEIALPRAQIANRKG